MTSLLEQEGIVHFYPRGICSDQVGRGTRALLLKFTFTEMLESISFWGQMSEMNCSIPTIPQQFNCREKGRDGVRETNKQINKMIKIEMHLVW